MNGLNYEAAINFIRNQQKSSQEPLRELVNCIRMADDVSEAKALVHECLRMRYMSSLSDDSTNIVNLWRSLHLVWEFLWPPTAFSALLLLPSRFSLSTVLIMVIIKNILMVLGFSRKDMVINVNNRWSHLVAYALIITILSASFAAVIVPGNSTSKEFAIGIAIALAAILLSIVAPLKWRSYTLSGKLTLGEQNWNAYMGQVYQLFQVMEHSDLQLYIKPVLDYHIKK